MYFHRHSQLDWGSTSFLYLLDLQHFTMCQAYGSPCQARG